MRRIAVLVSNTGEGTNLEAMITGQTTAFNGQLVCVLSSHPDAPALAKAAAADIPTEVLDYQSYRAAGKPKTRYEEELAHKLQTYSPDLIVLCGWNHILSPTFLRFFPWRVVNLHPGLIADKVGQLVQLPDGTYADPCVGLANTNAIQAVLAAGQTYAGSTVHVVTENVDWGPVVARGMVPVEPGDTVESLYDRLKGKEHDILLHSLRELCMEMATVT